MANIKKNFNFRNGVQVDDDNLLVTSTGLVGIGTTVPTEALDVRGNMSVSGSVDINQVNVGVLTVTTLEPTKIIGAGISVVSGIVTATGSGIVTFYGDARFLQGMPTSQWADVDVGLGFTSIYNTGGNVGVATVDPRFTVQVGGDVDSSQNGVGISSVGNIKATGIVTASSFVGNLTGNITGATTISGNVDLNADIDVDGHTNLDNVSIAGVTTMSGDLTVTSGDVIIQGVEAKLHLTDTNNDDDYLVFNNNGTFKIYDATNNADRLQINSNGDVTIGGDTNFGAGIDVDGHTNLDNVSIAGVSTFSEDVVLGVGATVGFGSTAYFRDDASIRLGDSEDLQIYHDSINGHSYLKDSGTGNLILQSDNEIEMITFNPPLGGGSEKMLVATKNAGTKLYFDGNEKFSTSGVGVTVYNQIDTTNIVASGVITATTELNSPLIGVGTDVPVNEIQVRKSGNVEIQVTSDTGIAGLTVGREAGTNNTNNAEFRYGGGAGAPYSSAQSLDILNYGTGNFNYHISANNPGAAAGDFQWHKGVNSARLMTLTNTGRLGIGVTNPGETLTVAGVCTITSNSFVGGNLSISGNTTVGGNLTINGNLVIPSINTNLVGNVTGNLTGNVNATSGVSTFFKVGINTTIPILTANLDVTNGDALFKNVGIGSTEPDGILDVSGPLSSASKKFILLPKVSAGSTSVIQSNSAEGGGLIYNTTLKKLQFFNGTNWETVTSVEVTG